MGYFVLGPSDLYKLVKEVGKTVQNVRTFTTEATASLENNFEANLQLEEIRKAQRELNEAFSFRRSINVEADTNPFEVNAKSPRMPEQTELTTLGSTAVVAASATALTDDAEAAAAPAVAPKKKIRRRRVKKVVVAPVEEEDEEEDNYFSSDTSAGEVVNNVPDLSVEDEAMAESELSADKALKEANEQLRKDAIEEEAAEWAERRKERLERLEQASGVPSEEELGAASARFQAQLTGTWNDQILSKGDELNPLASIMDRLALLEREKQAADERLQEEFRLREENEERYYRKKRQLLEEAAAQVQAEFYLNPMIKNDEAPTPETTTITATSTSDTTVANAS